jgi:hypothetical protein
MMLLVETAAYAAIADGPGIGTTAIPAAIAAVTKR